MLNLETRREILGITVFQDADRASQFYYLPGPPHITREGGTPLFDLFSYRKGGETAATLAGGFLNMTVDLGIGDLKERIEGRLKEQHGDDVTLASVPFSKGTARVIALGEDSGAVRGGAERETAPGGAPLVARGPRFIENILGAGQPSLDGDNRAIFSFSLTEDGAAFFLGVLDGATNARPVGAIYELEYVGLLPAYDLEITIDFSSSYEYTRSRFTLGTLLFKADVDNIVEELQRRESIRIKETARTLELSTPQAVRERQDRIDRLVKDLATGALFQPSLTPGQPKVGGDTITAADPTTTVPATTPAAGVPPTGQVAQQFGPSAAVLAGMGQALNRDRPTADPATAGGASGAASGGVNGASGASGTPASGQGGQGGQAQPPTTAGDLWNRLGRPQAAYALRNIRQEERRTVTYNLSQVTAQKQTVAPQSFVQFMTEPRTLAQHIHVIDLNHPFFQRLNLNINAADVDFAAEGIVQMAVQVRYGVRPDGTAPKDTAEVILRGRGDSRDFTFFVDGRRTQQYEYKLIVDYRADFGIGVRDARIEGAWTPTEAKSLAVHPRWLERTLPVRLQLAPNVPDDVTEVQARVRYVNAPRGIDDSALVSLTATHREETVPVRLTGADERCEVQQTLFYADGTQEELPVVELPVAADAASGVVVVNAPRANRLDGDLLMLDPIGELASVVVDTQVSQGGAMLDARGFELTAAGKLERWSVRLPQRGVTPTLRYRERRIYRDGGLETEEWREPVSPSIVVGIPAEGVLPVAVRYLGPPPSALGLSAMVLDLDYAAPNGDPRFAQNTSLLITDDAATHTQDWKVRLPDRDARTYRWRLTLLNPDGTDHSTPFTADTRSTLLLRAPQA